eukprot:5526906-Alexandrium_andersonii.AAC.1
MVTEGSNITDVSHLPCFQKWYQQCMQEVAREHRTNSGRGNPRVGLTGEELMSWYESHSHLSWEEFERLSPWPDWKD